MKILKNPFSLALLPCFSALVIFISSPGNQFPFPDCDEYANLIDNLAENYQFGYSGPQYSSLSPYRRTPGFPVLAAVFQTIIPQAFFTVNLAFLYGIVFFTFKLAEEWKIRSRLVISILFLTCPGLIVCTTVPLAEISFIFWLILSIYCLLSSRTLTSALCLSATTLTRPVSIILFLPLAIWLFWRTKKIPKTVLFILIAISLPFLWTVRNYFVSGHFIYTTLSGYNLLYYKVGSYLSYKKNVPFDRIRNELASQLPDEKDPVLKSRAAQKLGKKLFQENFFGFWLWTPRNLIHYFMPDITPLLERLQITKGNRNTYDVLRRKGLWAAVMHYFSGNIPAIIITILYLIYYFFFILMLPLGVVHFYRHRQLDAVIFIIGLSLYFSFIAIGNLDWRFRMPLMPIYFITATSGMLFCREIWLNYLMKKPFIQRFYCFI